MVSEWRVGEGAGAGFGGMATWTGKGNGGVRVRRVGFKQRSNAGHIEPAQGLGAIILL